MKLLRPVIHKGIFSQNKFSIYVCILSTLLRSYLCTEFPSSGKASLTEESKLKAFKSEHIPLKTTTKLRSAHEEILDHFERNPNLWSRRNEKVIQNRPKTVGNSDLTVRKLKPNREDSEDTGILKTTSACLVLLCGQVCQWDIDQYENTEEVNGPKSPRCQACIFKHRECHKYFNGYTQPSFQRITGIFLKTTQPTDDSSQQERTLKENVINNYINANTNSGNKYDKANGRYAYLAKTRNKETVKSQVGQDGRAIALQTTTVSSAQVAASGATQLFKSKLFENVKSLDDVENSGTYNEADTSTEFEDTSESASSERAAINALPESYKNYPPNSNSLNGDYDTSAMEISKEASHLTGYVMDLPADSIPVTKTNSTLLTDNEIVNSPTESVGNQPSIISSGSGNNKFEEHNDTIPDIFGLGGTRQQSIHSIEANAAAGLFGEDLTTSTISSSNTALTMTDQPFVDNYVPSDAVFTLPGWEYNVGEDFYEEHDTFEEERPPLENKQTAPAKYSSEMGAPKQPNTTNETASNIILPFYSTPSRGSAIKQGRSMDVQMMSVKNISEAVTEFPSPFPENYTVSAGESGSHDLGYDESPDLLNHETLNASLKIFSSKNVSALENASEEHNSVESISLESTEPETPTIISGKASTGQPITLAEIVTTLSVPFSSNKLIATQKYFSTISAPSISSSRSAVSEIPVVEEYAENMSDALPPIGSTSLKHAKMESSENNSRLKAIAQGSPFTKNLVSATSLSYGAVLSAKDEPISEVSPITTSKNPSAWQYGSEEDSTESAPSPENSLNQPSYNSESLEKTNVTSSESIPASVFETRERISPIDLTATSIQPSITVLVEQLLPHISATSNNFKAMGRAHEQDALAIGPLESASSDNEHNVYSDVSKTPLHSTVSAVLEQSSPVTTLRLSDWENTIGTETGDSLPIREDESSNNSTESDSLEKKEIAFAENVNDLEKINQPSPHSKTASLATIPSHSRGTVTTQQELPLISEASNNPKSTEWARAEGELRIDASESTSEENMEAESLEKNSVINTGRQTNRLTGDFSTDVTPSLNTDLATTEQALAQVSTASDPIKATDTKEALDRSSLPSMPSENIQTASFENISAFETLFQENLLDEDFSAVKIPPVNTTDKSTSLKTESKEGNLPPHSTVEKIAEITSSTSSILLEDAKLFILPENYFSSRVADPTASEKDNVPDFLKQSRNHATLENVLATTTLEEPHPKTTILTITSSEFPSFETASKENTEEYRVVVRNVLANETEISVKPSVAQNQRSEFVQSENKSTVASDAEVHDKLSYLSTEFNPAEKSETSSKKHEVTGDESSSQEQHNVHLIQPTTSADVSAVHSVEHSTSKPFIYTVWGNELEKLAAVSNPQLKPSENLIEYNSYSTPHNPTVDSAKPRQANEALARTIHLHENLTENSEVRLDSRDFDFSKFDLPSAKLPFIKPGGSNTEVGAKARASLTNSRNAFYTAWRTGLNQMTKPKSWIPWYVPARMQGSKVGEIFPKFPM